jgi:hypothetical protein
VELVRSGDILHHKVTVDLVNTEPSGIEDRTTYKANVRLYVSSAAFSLSDNLRPVVYANPAPPAGLQLLDGWAQDIPCCGGRGRAMFEFDTRWPLHDRGVHQVYWQKQPGTLGDQVDVSWSDGAGHTYTINGDLGQDRVISLSPNGVRLKAGQPAQAALPSLGLGSQAAE